MTRRGGHSSEQDEEIKGLQDAFAARPEARSYRWPELTKGNKDATRELLCWLRTALRESRNVASYCPATGVLIAGDRGTGKTTVLLTAAQAVTSPDTFLDGVEPPEMREKLRPILDDLRGEVAWLDILDLEPIPSHANLLTTLLVRIRRALEKALGVEPKEHMPPSLLDEGDESPWDAIDQLVRDATHMWEDILPSLDVDKRVEQQIKAADIYAAFRDDLDRALDNVARALQKRRFGPGSNRRVVLVLPVDNVDRSVDHISNMRKLVRMTSGRQLWFVLAAGGSEFQLFLERAFYSELTTATKGPPSTQAWDEARTIARKQAATAMREVIPPIHQIKLRPVDAEEAWRFRIPARDGNGKSPELCALLERIPVRKRRDGDTQDRGGPEGGKEQAAKGPQMQLSDLFNIRGCLSSAAERCYREMLEAQYRYGFGDTQDRSDQDGSQEAGPPAPGTTLDPFAPFFSDAGRNALTLPIRSLLDLYLLLQRHVAREDTKGVRASTAGAANAQGSRSQPTTHETPYEDASADKAVWIAEEMLLNAINESDLPAWASERLRNRIIRNSARSRTFLDLSDRPLTSRRATSFFAQFSLYGYREPVAGTTIELGWPGDLQLHLAGPGHPEKLELPSIVAGWFMLLHDLLRLAPEPRIFGTPFGETSSQPLVVTQHTIEMRRHSPQIEFVWPEPGWSLYFEYSIMAALWRLTLHKAEKVLPLCDPRGAGSPRFFGQLAGLFRAAWLETIYVVATECYTDWDPPKAEWPPPPQRRKLDKSQWELQGLDEYRARVRRRILSLHQQCHGCEASDTEREVFCPITDRFRQAHKWLDTFTPLLLQPEFAPCADEWLSNLSDGSERLAKCAAQLGEHWKRKASFLRTRLDSMVLDALKRSSAYESLKSDLGQAELWGWLDQACERWFNCTADLRAQMGFLPELR